MSDVKTLKSKKSVQKFDILWVISLFGTAVGAGILFLPINAGLQGIWPFLLLSLLIGPLIMWAHQRLAFFVLSGSSRSQDITEVVKDHFGAQVGLFITFLYLLATYPILIIYGIGVTNTVDSFLTHQLAIEYIPRSVTAFVIIGLMLYVMQKNELTMLRVTEYLVFPLVFMLFAISLLLIPKWNGSAFQYVPSVKDFSISVWLILPTLIFSFNHSPAISTLTLSLEKKYGELAERKLTSILRMTTIILMFFVLFFVFSTLMTLTPEQLAEAKTENISILSYFANQYSNPYFNYAAPAIALVAIVSSFFGHYVGAREAVHGFCQQVAAVSGKTLDDRHLYRAILIFFAVTVWISAVINPSIVTLIETISGPVIAFILFLLPVIAINHSQKLKAKYSSYKNIIILVAGLVAMSAIFYQLVV